MIEYGIENKGKIILHYDITMACNNRCWYCYTLKTLDNKKIINDTTFNNVIKACNNYDGHIRMDLLGGEPLIVYNKIIELVNNTNCSEYKIISNLNFDPESERMKTITSFVMSHKNTMITGSWHYENNDDYFKQNVLNLKGSVHVVLLAGNDNIEYVFKQRDWLKQNNIPFDVEPIYGSETFQYTELFKGDIDQSHRLDIAITNKVVCELSSVKVDYDGNMRPICYNPFDLGNIKDGINLKETYCHKYHCKCTTYNYKRVF